MVGDKYQSDPNVLYSVILLLNQNQRTQIWKKYDIFDWMGEIGGIQFVLIGAIRLFVYPFSRFAYIMALARYSFLARTRDRDLFDNRVRYSELDGRKRKPNNN